MCQYVKNNEKMWKIMWKIKKNVKNIKKAHLIYKK